MMVRRCHQVACRGVCLGLRRGGQGVSSGDEDPADRGPTGRTARRALRLEPLPGEVAGGSGHRARPGSHCRGPGPRPRDRAEFPRFAKADVKHGDARRWI